MSITPSTYQKSHHNLTLIDTTFQMKSDTTQGNFATQQQNYLEQAPSTIQNVILTEEEIQTLEEEALQEAISAPRIGRNGEDRTKERQREGNGRGRRDDTRSTIRNSKIIQNRARNISHSVKSQVSILLVNLLIFIAC